MNFSIGNVFIYFNGDIRMGYRSKNLPHSSDPFHGIGHHRRTDGWNLLTASRDQQTAKSMLNNTKSFQIYTSPKVIYMA